LSLKRRRVARRGSPEDSGDTHRKIFGLFEILIKKQAELGSKIKILDKKISDMETEGEKLGDSLDPSVDNLILVTRGGG